MQVTLNAQTMMLEDIPLDEGYASEKVTAKDMRGKEITFGGQNGKTQIIISAPYLDEENFNEFDQLMKHEDLAIEDVQKYFILSSKADLKSDCDLPLLIDEEEHFGDEFGVRISEAPLKGKLTKALFIVSKDGAIFYEEIPSEINTPFNIEKIYQKTVAALACYTGKGCH